MKNTPEQILAVHLTEEEQSRFEDLISKKKEEGLSPAEEQELERLHAAI